MSPTDLSSKSLRFRAATPADIPLLRGLAERIWRASYAEMIPAEQIDYMLRWMYSPEKIAEELTSSVLWRIGLLGEEPVGYFAMTVPTDRAAELHKIYLLPEYQSRGFGQVMLANALKLARANGCPEITLRVNRQNQRALRAYERAGFRQVSAITADIGGGFVMDDFVLSRKLAP